MIQENTGMVVVDADGVTLRRLWAVHFHPITVTSYDGIVAGERIDWDSDSGGGHVFSWDADNSICHFIHENGTPPTGESDFVFDSRMGVTATGAGFFEPEPNWLVTLAEPVNAGLPMYIYPFNALVSSVDAQDRLTLDRAVTPVDQMIEYAIQWGLVDPIVPLFDMDRRCKQKWELDAYNAQKIADRLRYRGIFCRSAAGAVLAANDTIDLPLDTIDGDNLDGATLASNEITVPASGVWRKVIVRGRWRTQHTLGSTITAMQMNGLGSIHGLARNEEDQTDGDHVESAVIDVVPGDFFRIRIVNGAAGPSTTISPNDYLTWMEVIPVEFNKVL